MNFTTVYDDKQIDTNTYVSNNAAYGNDHASYPASFSYKFSQNSTGIKDKTGSVGDQINKRNLEGDEEEEADLVFAPGQPINLRIVIFDVEGRVYADENDAVCTVKFINNINDGRVISNPEGVAQNGVIEF